MPTTSAIQAKRDLRLLRNNYPLYARRVLRIRRKDMKLSPLSLNRAQEYLDARLNEQLARTGRIRALVLKGRQQGVSTYVTGRYYHRVSMNFGSRAFILSHEQQATDNLYGMVRRYHENMPDALKPVTGEDSAKSLYFSGLDSRFSIATAGAKETGRSATAQFFHGSEVAFWPNAPKHIAGIGQVIPDIDKTEIILESTANGIGNMFHSMWQDAVNGVSEYIAVFIPWFWQPEYRREVPEGFLPDAEEAEYAEAYGLDVEQIVWRRFKIASMGGDVNLFNQEYPATAEMAFMVAATSAMISPLLVQQARLAGPVDPYGPLILGVDPAEYGEDATAMIFRQGRVASDLERYHKRGPMEIAGIVANLIETRRPRAVCIDSTGSGIGVLDALNERGYKNVYGIKFGASALDSAHYKDRRTEIWHEMLTWFSDQPVNIPSDDALAADCTGLSYTYNSARQMVLESKEAAKKRGIDSPDSADALACTFGVSLSSETYSNTGGPSWRQRLKANNKQRGTSQAS